MASSKYTTSFGTGAWQLIRKSQSEAKLIIDTIFKKRPDLRRIAPKISTLKIKVGCTNWPPNKNFRRTVYTFYWFQIKSKTYQSVNYKGTVPSEVDLYTILLYFPSLDTLELNLTVFNTIFSTTPIKVRRVILDRCGINFREIFEGVEHLLIHKLTTNPRMPVVAPIQLPITVKHLQIPLDVVFPLASEEVWIYIGQQKLHFLSSIKTGSYIININDEFINNFNKKDPYNIHTFMLFPLSTLTLLLFRTVKRKLHKVYVMSKDTESTKESDSDSGSDDNYTHYEYWP